MSRLVAPFANDEILALQIADESALLVADDRRNRHDVDSRLERRPGRLGRVLGAQSRRDTQREHRQDAHEEPTRRRHAHPYSKVLCQ